MKCDGTDVYWGNKSDGDVLILSILRCWICLPHPYVTPGYTESTDRQHYCWTQVISFAISWFQCGHKVLPSKEEKMIKPANISENALALKCFRQAFLHLSSWWSEMTFEVSHAVQRENLLNIMWYLWNQPRRRITKLILYRILKKSLGF